MGRRIRNGIDYSGNGASDASELPYICTDTVSTKEKIDENTTAIADLKNTINNNTITGGASTITTSDLTASRVLVSNSSGKVAVSAVTSTELSYLDGVTSNVQTQLNNKSPLLTTGYFTASWNLTAYTYSTTPTFNIGKSGYTPIGIIGFDAGDTDCVSVKACDLTSSTAARMEIIHTLETSTAHSGTASIRVLYVKN